MDKIVICTSVGVYTEALTRGKEYKVIAEDEEKDQIKIIGDNNRARWFRQGFFVPHGTSVPVLSNWQFDDVIHDSSEESLQHIEITFLLSNGQKRWCSICTKAGLVDYIKCNMDGNVFYMENLIIVKNFSHEVVEAALIELDQQNQLIQSSRELS